MDNLPCREHNRFVLYYEHHRQWGELVGYYSQTSNYETFVGTFNCSRFASPNAWRQSQRNSFEGEQGVNNKTVEYYDLSSQSFVRSFWDFPNNSNIANQLSAVLYLHSTGRYYSRYLNTKFIHKFIGTAGIQYDLCLSFQMIGSATTYLVVLIQFESTNRQSFRQCSQLQNITKH